MKYFLFFLFISLTTQYTPAYATDAECIDPATLAPKYVGTEYLIFTGTSLKTEELAVGMQNYALETVQVDSVAQGKVSGTITIKYTDYACGGGPGVRGSTNVYIVEQTAADVYVSTDRLLPTDYAAKVLNKALASTTTPSTSSTTAPSESPERITLLSRLVGLLNQLVSLLSH